MPKHRRHAAAPQDAASGTSLLELALYGVLAAVVAAAVLLVGDQPIWQPIVVVMIAFVILGMAMRLSTGSRHGRRRRR